MSVITAVEMEPGRWGSQKQALLIITGLEPTHQESFFTFKLTFFPPNFWLHHMACRILVPQPGVEPMPPAEVWS